MKLCSKCRLEKPTSDYHKDSQKPDGLRTWCKSCVLAQQAEYRRSPTGQAIRQTYVVSSMGQKRLNAGQSKYRRSQKRRASWAAYKQSPKGRITDRQYAARRRERSKQLDSLIGQQLYTLIEAVFNHRCFCCGSEQALQIDHHYPLSRGFGLTPDNATLLCKQCNVLKGNKLPEQFYSQNQLQQLEYIHALLL